MRAFSTVRKRTVTYARHVVAIVRAGNMAFLDRSTYLLCRYASFTFGATMRVQIQKWGNSLALRIPKPFADDAGVTAGSVVDVAVVKGRLVATPVTQPRVHLAALLKQVTKRNRHGETDTGRPVGRESW